MEACVVGESSILISALPYLLARAGFAVDVITTSGLPGASRYVRKVDRLGTADAMVEMAWERISQRDRPYDWVIACDDPTLWSLNCLDWPADRKPRHLASSQPGKPSHIYSKIGLSQALTAGGVQTPAYRVVASWEEVPRAAKELGYPVVVKTDSDRGGFGVCRCSNERDTRALSSRFWGQPLLVQRCVVGQELDLSAIFFDGQLVHFAYSRIDRALRDAQAISAVRTFFPLPLVDEAVLQELRQLGRALDANGCVNLTCIDAADGSGRYYFEADMRPNAWVDMSRFYGEDAADRIRRWFATGETLCQDDRCDETDYSPVQMAHYLRVQQWELLVNRFHVWRFIPWDDRSVVIRQICARFVTPLSQKILPKRVRRIVRRGIVAARIAFP